MFSRMKPQEQELPKLTQIERQLQHVQISLEPRESEGARSSMLKEVEAIQQSVRNPGRAFSIADIFSGFGSSLRK